MFKLCHRYDGRQVFLGVISGDLAGSRSGLSVLSIKSEQSFNIECCSSVNVTRLGSCSVGIHYRRKNEFP